jgi:Trypsin-like peptidase domain
MSPPRKSTATRKRIRRRAPTTRKPARRSTGATFSPDDAVSLAQAIAGSRQQFADAFRAAQANRRPVLEFEAVSSAVTDAVTAYARAFMRAATLGWLAELCLSCLDHRIVDESFITAAAEFSPDDRLAGLQAMVDPDIGFTDPLVLSERIKPATRQVCRIEINGRPAGTGFLLRPDLVMTAHHVVTPLLTPDHTAAIAGSAAKLRVRFDYARNFANGAVFLSMGQECRVAEQWLVDTSPCTREEYLNQLPDDLETLLGFWDYAVIQLAELPGPGHEGLTLGRRPIKRRRPLMIIQYPEDNPVLSAVSTVSGFLGSGGFRVTHTVNTKRGSSGSPCLNGDFEVVCLHQAEMPAGNGDTNDLPKRNRAIPMSRILEQWQMPAAPGATFTTARLLTADTSRVSQHPVFGRNNVQRWVSRAAADRGKGGTRDRFLAVSGSKGTGKSFTTAIIRAMLPADEHNLLECLASDFNTVPTATEFATKYLLNPIGANAASLPLLDSANTSDNAWLTYQFVGDLLTVIDRARGNRMIWLILDELDEVVLPDQGQVRKLLDLIYSRAEATPWLRIVLLGIDAVPVPGTLAWTEQDFIAYQNDVALANDVGDYLVFRLEAGGISMSPDDIRAQGLAAVRNAVADFGGRIDHPSLLQTVADATMELETNLGLRRK